ncbi:MAG: hypothetical protein ACYDAC_00360 [Candidatus Dormibacteria bacterium]
MRTQLVRLAVVAPLLALGAAATPAAADGGQAFDAANLTGTCAAVEMTVATGYQFVVKPDIQVPRATSVVEEGTSEAIASPADPGDSVDGLAALGIPEAEGYFNNGYPGAPSPFAGKGLSTLPHPFDSVGSTLVSNPFNTTLTYPYEHADAGYPNAQSPGTQTQTLGGLPAATTSDPSGILTIDGATGTAQAGSGFAVADAGAGASAGLSTPASPAAVTSLPALGVSIGRVSAHSEARVLADRVTEVATCTLDDIEIAVPGAPTIHIGALVATATAQRLLSAAGATGAENVEFSGVTVNGTGATLDQRGLTVNGATVPLNPAQSVSPGSACPSGAPCSGAPALTLTGSQVATRQPTANEYAVSATGATLTITTTAPVPASITPSCSQPPSCGAPLSNTPVTYTISLGNVASEAYGLPAVPLASSSPSSLGSLASGFASIVGGSLGSVTPATAPEATTTPGSAAQPSTLASIMVTPGERGLILGLASVLELLLLGGVARNWLAGRRGVLAPAETTDLP